MADNVGFKVEGFDSLRSQLREATMEAQKLAQQFGQFSPQALQAAQRVADLKDEIDDVNGSINALTGAGKIQAFGKAVGTIAGGFSAAQGAIALFGGESEDLQKTLVKLQGAMALSQGLAALEDVGQAFSNLGVAAVDAFNKIKAAILANPWTALATAIAAAAAALAVYALSADEATEQTVAFNNAAEKAYGSQAAGQIARLKVLQSVMNDIRTSERDRKTAIEELDKLLPGYNAKNKDTKEQIEGINNEITKEIELITKRAKAKAAEEELARIYKEQFKLQQDLNRISQGEFTFGENVKRFVSSLNPASFSGTLDLMVGIAGEMEKLTKQEQFFLGITKELGVESLKEPAKDNPQNPKAVKKLKETYSDFNAELERNLRLAKERAKLTVETFVPKDVIDEVSVSGVVTGGKPETTIVQVVQDEEAKAKQISDIKAGARQFELNREKEYYDKLTEYLATYKVKDKENLADFNKFKEEKLAEAALFTEFYQQRENLIYEENFAEIEKIEKDFYQKRETKRKEDLAKEQAALEKSNNEKATTLREDFNKGLLTEEEFKAKQLEQEKQFLRDKIALLEKYGEDASALKLELAEKDTAVDKKSLEDFLSINQEKINAAISSAQVLVDAVGSIYAAQQAKELKDAGDNKVKQEEINKKYFEKNKKVEIANAIISTLSGALDAFTTSLKLDPTGILGGILAAAALAGGYAQVAKIRNTPYPESDSGAKGSKFQNGGLIRGASHEQGGIRSAVGELEGGEFIMNRNSTSAFLPLLEAMNSMGNGNQMRYGGQSPVIKTYVVASEMSSQQEANKRISDLARI
jgi:hypothetical protein